MLVGIEFEMCTSPMKKWHEMLSMRTKLMSRKRIEAHRSKFANFPVSEHFACTMHAHRQSSYIHTPTTHSTKMDNLKRSKHWEKSTGMENRHFRFVKWLQLRSYEQQTIQNALCLQILTKNWSTRLLSNQKLNYNRDSGMRKEEEWKRKQNRLLNCGGIQCPNNNWTVGYIEFWLLWNEQNEKQ